MIEIKASHSFIDYSGKPRTNVKIDDAWYEIKTDNDNKLLDQWYNDKPQDQELIRELMQ